MTKQNKTKNSCVLGTKRFTVKSSLLISFPHGTKMAQVVECLPHKCEATSSNPSTTDGKKKKDQK
jgi:hypothetical protein